MRPVAGATLIAGEMSVMPLTPVETRVTRETAPLASWMLLAAGVCVFVLAATYWINELRHDRPS